MPGGQVVDLDRVIGSRLVAAVPGGQVVDLNRVIGSRVVVAVSGGQPCWASNRLMPGGGSVRRSRVDRDRVIGSRLVVAVPAVKGLIVTG